MRYSYGEFRFHRCETSVVLLKNIAMMTTLYLQRVAERGGKADNRGG